MVQPESSDSVITFVTNDGREIQAPGGLEFHKYSLQTMDYLRCYGHLSDKVPDTLMHSCRMPLPKDSNVTIESLKIIFRFLEQVDPNPNESVESPEKKENAAVNAKENNGDMLLIPPWVQAFFQIYTKDAILSAINSANYLACQDFLMHAMSFIVKHLENFTVENMCEYLNETSDEGIDESHDDEGILSMKNWKEVQKEISDAQILDKKAEKERKEKEQALEEAQKAKEEAEKLDDEDEGSDKEYWVE